MKKQVSTEKKREERTCEIGLEASLEQQPKTVIMRMELWIWEI